MTSWWYIALYFAVVPVTFMIMEFILFVIVFIPILTRYIRLHRQKKTLYSEIDEHFQWINEIKPMKEGEDL